MGKPYLLRLDDEDLKLLESLCAAEKIPSRSEGMRRCIRMYAPQAIQEARERRAKAAAVAAGNEEGSQNG
jgi:metal-responsive CopG/Arc/MetJ family transcriptional regulator